MTWAKDRLPQTNMSLKKFLQQKLEDQGEITRHEVENWCRITGIDGKFFEMSNAERRLRELPCQPLIENGHIKSWQIDPAAPKKPKLVYEYDRVNNKVLVYLK